MSTIRRPPARLDRGRSAGDVVIGVLALAAIAALVLGVPFALLTFFGSPIPHSMPSTETLTQRLDTTALMHVLVLIVWLAWLQLAACVLVEAYAGIRGVGLPARVPLAGGPQALAHRLVVAALLLFTATTAVMPALTGARATHVQRLGPPERPEPVQAAHSAAPASLHTQTAAPRQDTPDLTQKNEVRKIYRVRPTPGRHHESLWEIAEKCLGDGRRYREIYQLNKGKLQPDGTRLTMASLIRPGWVLDMPADATHIEIVEKGPHDAQREYGVPRARQGSGSTEKQAVDAARRAERQDTADDRADRQAGRPPIEEGPEVPSASGAQEPGAPGQQDQGSQDPGAPAQQDPGAPAQQDQGAQAPGAHDPGAQPRVPRIRVRRPRVRTRVRMTRVRRIQVLKIQVLKIRALRPQVPMTRALRIPVRRRSRRLRRTRPRTGSILRSTPSSRRSSGRCLRRVPRSSSRAAGSRSAGRRSWRWLHCSRPGCSPGWGGGGVSSSGTGRSGT